VFVLILASRRGSRKGAAFVFGWIVSLAVVVAVTVLATGNEPPKSNTAPSLGALAVKIALGTTLLVVALRRYRRLGRPKTPKKAPKWQAGVDNMSPWYAMGLAVFAQSWALVAAGAATVLEAKLSSWADYLMLIYFCLLASAPYLLLEVYATARPVQTHDVLARLRGWIDGHTDALIIWVSLVVGLWLIGKSLYLIVT
jgi:hypothetical protein